MYAFDYHRPDRLDTVLDLLQDESALLLAGGQTLIAAMKHRLAEPSMLIDLAGIAGLDEIRHDGDELTIGAMARHDQVARSGLVKHFLPALASLAGQIGDPQVRNRGTIGGSIANHDPAADYPAACLGFGAIIVTNKREIAADDFFLGLFETALDAGELVLAVRFKLGKQAAWQKFKQPASRYALVGVLVARDEDKVRVAVTGAGEEGVMRCPPLEAALEQDFSPDRARETRIEADGLLSNFHGSDAYRAHLISVLTARAVAMM
ncbi:MAG: xanthine dehydrogenase family protein subunit M [Pseudomonadota bacterium]